MCQPLAKTRNHRPHNALGRRGSVGRQRALGLVRGKNRISINKAFCRRRARSCQMGTSDIRDVRPSRLLLAFGKRTGNFCGRKPKADSSAAASVSLQARV